MHKVSSAPTIPLSQRSSPTPSRAPTAHLTYPAKTFKHAKQLSFGHALPQRSHSPRLPLLQAAQPRAEAIISPSSETAAHQRILLRPEGPVQTCSRPNDVRDVSHFTTWAKPGWFGGFILESVFGKAARAAGLYWPDEGELRRLAPQLEQFERRIRNADVAYPDFFLRHFHGYNSNFAADSVAQQASAMAVVPAIVTRKDLKSAFAERLQRLSEAAASYKAHQQGAADKTARIVDLACGTGVTSRVLARQYPQAHVVGVDLSAPMLAWAKASTEWPADMFATAALEQLCLNDNPQDLQPRLSWLHDNAECTRLQAGQFDLATLHFAAHELPTEAMRNIAAEAYRLLQPGGWFAVIDTDQQVNNLHDGPELMRQLAGLMAREPHLADYLREDLGVILADANFKQVDSDSRVQGCTLVLGQKPF